MLNDYCVSFFFGDYSNEYVALFWLAIIWVLLLKYFMEKPWGWRKKSKESVAAFLASRDVRFSQFHIEALKISTPRYEYITSLRFHKLRSSLRSEEVLPIEAVRAFGLKIKEIHEKCNVLIDVLVDAFARAEILQRDFQGKDKPPLYGMPFSVKGNFFLEGHDCTIGFPKFLNMPKDETCSMVSTLIELGGIPICVTNVPQGLMSFSCSNPLYGTTLNPTLTVPHTCGGSSGGEACLVAAGGIPFGTGSDLAGSLRIPAAFCGVVSLKPTEDRLNITGTHGGIPGKFRLSLSFGFFTKTVEEHIELYDIYLNSAAHMRYSPASSPLPFNIRQRQMQRKFKIGYYMNNGFLQPAPACQRVVEETLNNLVMYGHQIEAFDIPEPTLMARLVLQNVMPDGGTYMKNLFSNDIVDVNMGSFINLLKIPNFLRKWASYLIGFVSPHLAQMCRVRLDSVDDVRHMHETTDNYRRKFIKHFTDLQLDAIICPAFPVHAVDSKWPSKLSVCAVETALYNMLNMPAGVVPVSKVTPSDIEMCSNPKAFNQDCLWNGRYNPILWDMKAACDSMDHVGAPLAVQVVTLPYQEEICLLVMKEIERVKKILEEKSWHSSVSSQQSAVAPSRRPSAHSVLYQSSS